jgi:hypothetical protein
MLKVAIDLGPELTLRRGRRARANAARARAQHSGCGVGCLPVPAACPWAACPVQAGHLAHVALCRSSVAQAGRAGAMPLGRKRIRPSGL